MSVSNIDTFVLDFSNPAVSNSNPERSRVPANLSFELVNNNNIRTLSTNGVESGDDVEGLLYVPTLAAGDPCRNLSRPYIPPNATELADLPQTDYPYVAFAPWISAECALAYLAAASSGSEAFITYLLDNSTQTPPPLVSPVWALNDGGSTWSQIKFPVYAIPSSNGASIMQQMALYSGNITQAPQPALLLEQYAPTDYIRLYSTFNTGSADHYPTLWAFLLIVLGIVLLIVGITSCTMRYNQRRARNRLRRRVLAGEIDLEAMGLTKPRHITQAEIDALPLVPYTPHDQKPPLPLDNLPPASKASDDSAIASPQNYNQPTCPICLEDYTPGKTTVRTLPCHHIYHPTCIDPHLLSSSALCPVCKARVPTARDRNPSTTTTTPNTPVITNLMVRRERHLRLLQERRNAAAAAATSQSHPTRVQRIRRHFGRPLLPVVGRGMRAETGTTTTPHISQPPRAAAVSAPNIEMRSVSNPDAAPPTAPNPQAPPPSVPAAAAPPPSDPVLRREWARRRASALLHRHSVAVGASSPRLRPEEEEEGRGGWRGVVRGVFPGFRH